MSVWYLVSLSLQLHDLVEVGHTPALLRLPVQLQSPETQLQLLTLRLQLHKHSLHVCVYIYRCLFYYINEDIFD